MTCEDAQSRLHDFVKRRLDPALHTEVGTHVEGCAACSTVERAEHALDELLEQRLRRYEAPTALKRRLGLLMGRPGSARARGGRASSRRRWRRVSHSSRWASSCSEARVLREADPRT